MEEKLEHYKENPSDSAEIMPEPTEAGAESAEEGKKPLPRRITEKFTAWCAEDSTAARFERTLAQGAIACVATGLATGDWGPVFVTALIMAVLTPIQAEIGKGQEDE